MTPAHSTNLLGLRTHWRSDLVAGFSVALVALPLALGIATAAGAPPISGLASAILAGLLTTFLRGSKVAINGPGNSLIVLVAAAFIAFGGGPEVFPHVLGVVVVSGAIQVAFGLLRLGKLGDLIPAAVVQGMLAAIGLIIVGKQAHVLLGERSTASSPIGVFLELPETLAHIHPAAALLGAVSLLIVIVHPRIKAKVVHFIPSPLWVVMITVPMALGIEFFDEEITGALGRSYALEPAMLVTIPEDLLGSLASPDFSRIGEPGFWMAVVTMTLVTSIENIVSVKAVDKLDSHRRQSNLDRDLVAVGLSTMAAGALGGLPILTVVARSSVNVNHGAETGWSNFFHGLLLLVFVVALGPVIEEISLAALAGILVYTGFKLTAPHVVEDTLRKGPDHFLVFITTIAATLTWGLLWGIVIGMFAEVTSHFLILGMRPPQAMRALRSTAIETMKDASGAFVLRVTGVANFLHVFRMRSALTAVPADENIILDFSGATLVDNTLLEYCNDYRRRYGKERFMLIGLEAHRAISDHPDALHARERRKHEQWLTPRQKTISETAEKHGWSFDAQRDWDRTCLDQFHFFRTHPVEFRDTIVEGTYEVEGQEVSFTLADVTFDEGALIPEVYHATAQVVRLPTAPPKFVLEKEDLVSRALELAGLRDIDFDSAPAFSRRYALKGPDEEAIRRFFTAEVLAFFEQADAYHVESEGGELVVFKTFMRRATSNEIERMLAFSERLAEVLTRSSA